jgi:hypothetical protein
MVGGWVNKNGRTFLVEIFQGREDLADSVNHLLVVSLLAPRSCNVPWFLPSIRTN